MKARAWRRLNVFAGRVGVGLAMLAVLAGPHWDAAAFWMVLAVYAEVIGWRRAA